MSTRGVPRTVDERIAAYEAQQRRQAGDLAVTPTDTRYLYLAKGDILVGQGDSAPVRLPAPPTPPGPGMYILRYNPGSDVGVEWAFISWLPGTITVS